MPFPSRSAATVDEHSLKKYTRTRASSFNHPAARRQQADSPFNTTASSSARRPSFDSHQRRRSQQQRTKAKASHSNYLQVNQQHHTSGGASSIDESGSEENDEENDPSYEQPVPASTISTDEMEASKSYLDSPSPSCTEEHNRSFANSFKEKLVIQRKSTRKGAGANSGSDKGVFSNILGSKSSSSSTTTNSGKQLYDDGSNAIYPPPQKQTEQRDQYGFLKSSQWISEDAFDAFDGYYAPIMKRRLLKWRQLLAENNDQWPARSSKIKRYIRKGIPPELRGQASKAWLHYSGGKAKMDANKGVFYDLVERAEAMGNLHRTFPENIQFRPESHSQSSTPITPQEKMNIPIIKSLKRVLLAFSIHTPSIGYCQSLNYIAGMLLLFMDEEETFWTFVTLINDILPPNTYDVTMEGANVDQNVLMILISERYPQVWNRIAEGKSFWECEEQEGTGMPTCSLVTSHWFLTLFINILPIESVLRVWDCLFYDGQKVLFRIALGIFKLNESEILAVNDPLEVFQVIQNMPKRMVDCHKLIDGTYLQYASATRVSNEEIRDRRELFKKRRDERRRNIPVQKGRKLLKRGTVRGAIIHRAKEARYFVERAKTVRK
ncbi:hypothetical protein [Parasitella parasitica]|uniref:Rab-GAP TBC domain-containing protein n=1 Tax=Parasitella parasitica TaxID=35722 RepID=A0A0B7NT67_9FUNG|nr:hypothetical protein [Parasitella parasitica]